ncbi:MAG: VOC family protein [Bryobacterales bacterium]|nr:VOC family protein [Bryobacterales bacterium]
MAQLLRSAPYLPVTDVEPVIEHYERVLGFTCEYKAGAPIEFAILSRDGLPLMLRRVEDATKICPNEQQGGAWDVFYWVDDALALHAEMQGKGATVTYGPTLQAYQVLEFAVRDPAGYVLGFGESKRG